MLHPYTRGSSMQWQSMTITGGCQWSTDVQESRCPLCLVLAQRSTHSIREFSGLCVTAAPVGRWSTSKHFDSKQFDDSMFAALDCDRWRCVCFPDDPTLAFDAPRLRSTQITAASTWISNTGAVCGQLKGKYGCDPAAQHP